MALQSATQRAPGKRAAKLTPEERRAQLLDCAITVFSRRGLGSANHADVAAEAGVAPPTVFSYFPTRDSLVEAVLAEVQRVIFDNAAEAAADAVSLPERLLAILRQYADFFDVDSRYARLWVAWSTSFQDAAWPLYQRAIDRTFKLHRRLIEAAIADGEPFEAIDPDMSACQFMGAATVIVQMKLQKFEAAQIERYMGVVVHGAVYQS